jgi:hypothetical protein
MPTFNANGKPKVTVGDDPPVERELSVHAYQNGIRLEWESVDETTGLILTWPVAERIARWIIKNNPRPTQ